MLGRWTVSFTRHRHASARLLRGCCPRRCSIVLVYDRMGCSSLCWHEQTVHGRLSYSAFGELELARGSARADEPTTWRWTLRMNIKGNNLPTCDFIWDSSFVVLAVRNPNQKVPRSYELYRRRYSTSKIWIIGLWNFHCPILRRIHGLMELTAACGRGENVVWVGTILKTKIKFFFNKYFAIWSV